MLGCLKSPDMLAPARRREIGGGGKGRGQFHQSNPLASVVSDSKDESQRSCMCVKALESSTTTPQFTAVASLPIIPVTPVKSSANTV